MREKKPWHPSKIQTAYVCNGIQSKAFLTWWWSHNHFWRWTTSLYQWRCWLEKERDKRERNVNTIRTNVQRRPCVTFERGPLGHGLKLRGNTIEVAENFKSAKNQAHHYVWDEPSDFARTGKHSKPPLTTAARTRRRGTIWKFKPLFTFSHVLVTVRPSTDVSCSSPDILFSLLSPLGFHVTNGSFARCLRMANGEETVLRMAL